MDRGYIERNEASRARLRALLDRLTDEDLRRKVGDWTVAMSLAHLAFWDRFSHLRWIETVASGREVPVAGIAVRAPGLRGDEPESSHAKKPTPAPCAG